MRAIEWRQECGGGGLGLNMRVRVHDDRRAASAVRICIPVRASTVFTRLFTPLSHLFRHPRAASRSRSHTLQRASSQTACRWQSTQPPGPPPQDPGADAAGTRRHRGPTGGGERRASAAGAAGGTAAPGPSLT